jgi:hypothetical protein
MKFFITFRIITKKVCIVGQLWIARVLQTMVRPHQSVGGFYCNYCMNGQNNATYLYQRGGQPNSNGMIPLK